MSFYEAYSRHFVKNCAQIWLNQWFSNVLCASCFFGFFLAVHKQAWTWNSSPISASCTNSFEMLMLFSWYRELSSTDLFWRLCKKKRRLINWFFERWVIDYVIFCLSLFECSTHFEAWIFTPFEAFANGTFKQYEIYIYKLDSVIH